LQYTDLGCPLDGGDIIQILTKSYALGQGVFFGMHAQKLTKYHGKGIKR